MIIIVGITDAVGEIAVEQIFQVKEQTIVDGRVPSLGKPIVMGQQDQVAKRTYKGDGFALIVPEDWRVQKLDANRTMFIGPKIGNSHFGFYVTRSEREGKDYLDAVKTTKEQQTNYTNYTILEEKDISQADFKAYLRRSSWYVEDIDMVLFVREIFTQSPGYVFVLSASIPNTPHRAELDKLAVIMMNSFRFDQK